MCYQDLLASGPLEFLLLSECALDSYSSKYTRKRWLKSLNAHSMKIPSIGKAPTWDLYWAMVVSEVNGVTERIGLGQIYQTALSKSYPPGPVWKETILG
jgi:hypothetical protein